MRTAPDCDTDCAQGVFDLGPESDLPSRSNVFGAVAFYLEW